MGRVSTGHGDTQRTGSNPPHDHLSPTRTRTHYLLASPHSTNSLCTAASSNFQGLVETLHFLALLLLTAGLLLLWGQGCLPLHVLHVQQLQKELEKGKGAAWTIFY